MSLDGAKLICLGKDPLEHKNVILAKGKTFKFGYYMDCDVVLEHSDALGLHCTIDCDAFGRVTIANLSKDQDITLNGKPLKKLRPLLHNTEICIFDKKFLWVFEKDEDLECATPSQHPKKSAQPPNSEPGRRWRTHDNRLTIHTFSYSIKSGNKAQSEESQPDQNETQHTCQTIDENNSEPTLTKILSPVPSKMNDLIDLETPKPKHESFAGQKTPLISFSFSETVITSYSPCNTNLHSQAKSYAVVQSPLSTPRKLGTQSDLTPLRPFNPLVLNHRSSMHLIDLTTPIKRTAPKSPIKVTQKIKIDQLRAVNSSDFSVHSTDEESVIELSDDGSFAPSPVIKTPPRSRTPQSLMKHAILSSAKKVIRKPLQPPAAPPPLTPSTPKSPTTARVRFQSLSTPQRKSLARTECSSVDQKKASTSAVGTHGQFKQTASPLVLNHRTSMHHLDLTSPIKRAAPKSPFKVTQRNKIIDEVKEANSSAHSTSSPVFSVHSTDEESVIELSDAGSFSPSPVLKTPPRSRTPQSLMKHAILSSAKKASRKNLQPPAATTPLTPSTPKSPTTARVRFQSLSTPQRKSLARAECSSVDQKKVSTSVVGKLTNSMVTSTPFRADQVERSKRRSSILRSPSTSLTQSSNKSRTSLMLRQVLKASPKHNKTEKSPLRKESLGTPSKDGTKLRKSVSFLEQSAGDTSNANKTFSIEEKQDCTNEIGASNGVTTLRKDATFSPEKKLTENLTDDCIVVSLNETADEEPLKRDETKDAERLNEESKLSLITDYSTVAETPIRTDNKQRASIKPLSCVTLSSKCKSTTVEVSSTTLDSPRKTEYSLGETDAQPDTHIDNTHLSVQQTPQSSKGRLRKTPLSIKPSSAKNLRNIIDEEDFEGLDSVFKTPKARNLMILSSPKSIALKKPTTDSVELMHSTEFDLSTNLDVLFKTPQSELTINRAETTITALGDNDAITHTRSPEEAFDKLVGRSTVEKSYSRKRSVKQNVTLPLDTPRDPDLPKTDIQEWIETVNQSIKHSEVDREEIEISYITTDQSEVTKDPLMMSTISEGIPTTNKKKIMDKSHADEIAMTVGKDGLANDTERETPLRDPLEVTIVTQSKKPISPNISGIDLLDHTSESAFSETLAISDDSSEKENFHHIASATLDDTVTQIDAKISPDKAKREMEEAFENFEKERRILEDKRLVSTPEPKKTEANLKYENKRKTLGNPEAMDALFDVKSAKQKWEMELAFEHFEEEPVLSVNRAAKAPEPKKSSPKDHRRTMDTKFVPEKELDLEAAREEREMELAFENFEEEPVLAGKRAAKTPEPKKSSLKDHRRTMGTKFVPEKELDLEAAKEEREMELAFENFKEEPVLVTNRSAKTPEPKKSSLKDHRRTMGTKFVPEKEFDLEAAKEEREMELTFENFEEEPVLTGKRAAKTPEPKKSSLKDHRRTMGTKFVPEKELDLEAAKEEREMELAFENFKEEPVLVTNRSAKTPEPKKSSLKDHRRTMGTKFVPEKELDLEAAKEEREMELAFENFKEEPVLVTNRSAKTPEPKKSSLKDHRRTMGTKFVPEKELDLEAAKEEREMELAFEHFKEEPVLVTNRSAKTPEHKKSSLKDHRRTMGTKFVPEKELDLKAAREEREMELAFENFEEEPVLTTNKAAKTPEPKKSSLKDHRRTMGTKFVPEKELDLKAAREEREMELAFENFEEEPVLTTNKAAKTPEPKKSSLKDHRRTMGTKFVPEKELDLKAAREEREMELAFENFEEEPVLTTNKAAKTPEPKKSSLKDHRRTMGTKFVPEKELDLKAAREEREMELAFENFEEEPVLTGKRAAKTPEPKKSSLKEHRRTMGTEFVPEKELDLEAAKEEREMELAFENFEEEPVLTGKSAAKTPEPKKSSLKDHRRTIGTKFVPEKELDLKAAREEREMELAFENFEEEPVLTTNKAAKTPEPKKSSLKDYRRTMGTKFVPEKELDLKAAREEREMELAFENFEEEPVLTGERAAKTPEPKKSSLKEHRRTMGTEFVPEKELDLEAAKEEREMELAFENFEEEPVLVTNKAAKTPEPKKSSLKDHRRTMGTKFVPEKELDLKAAREEREMELAFENFEEEPVLTGKRAAKTPEPKKSSLKEHRRTMGTEFVPEKELDLEAAKEEREMELAFENFEEEPVLVTNKAAKTPEPKKSSLKDHRRTMGTKFVPEKELDLEAAKEEREMELAFENFEEEPVLTTNRSAKTPEHKKSSLKDHRRTMGTKFVPEKELDLEAAREEREMELAFENFKEEPVLVTNRSAKTPEHKKSSLKDHRRTMGTKFVPEKELDLEAAKEEREMELAFENFEEEPVLTGKRAAKTPEPKKSSLKDHRRTMGTKFVPETELDLEAAKEEREMELAFENFKEEPVLVTNKAAKTPEPKKSSLKDHRRTMGTKFVPEKELDLEAAREEREMELAFENFKEEPVLVTNRSAKTPEHKKSSLKDHRRTMGTKFVPEKELDLKAAKEEREMELAFENFEEEPVLTTNRAAKTPEPKKSSLKDHRRTMGTKFVPETELDLEAAKKEREMELAFENFKEEPVLVTNKAAKTPEPKRSSLKDHRRTMGTKFVPEKELDLEAAREEREMELAFENFKEEPVLVTNRSAKTPEHKKSPLKDHRRTMGTKFVPEKELDLKAAREEREMELAFENFEEEPVLTTNKAAKTPEPKKSSLKDHRRTMGTKFVPEKELDLKAAREEREMELTFENAMQSEANVSLEDQTKLEAGISSPVQAIQNSSHSVKKESDSIDDERRTADAENGTHDTNPTALSLRGLRRRHNTIDEKEIKQSVSVRSTKKRLISLDTAARIEDNEITDGAVEVLKTSLETQKADVEGSTRNRNAVGKKTETQIESTDVESECTDDEKKHERPTRRKRGFKVKAIQSLQPHVEENQHLEPIIEEAKKHRESALNEALPQQELTKLSLNLQAEVDKDMRDPNKCTRSVALNVVLLKSSSSQVQNTKDNVKLKNENESERDFEIHPVKRELDAFKVENTNKNETIEKESLDIDEVISSTPVTKGNQRRRVQKKPESPKGICGLGLRRTRRGSVQQDVDVKVESVDAVELFHSTPLRSMVSLKTEVMPSTVEKSTPIKRRVRKPTEVEDIGEVIPSTPLPPKTRGRRGIQKSGGTSSTRLNEDSKADEGGVNLASANGQNAPAEETDEIVPSTPMQAVRRGRRVKSVKKADSTPLPEETAELTSVSETIVKIERDVHEGRSVAVLIQGSATEELNQVDNVESDIKTTDGLNNSVKTESEDRHDSKTTTLNTSSEHKVEHEVELIEISKENRVASKTRGRRAATTLTENKPRRRGVVELAAKDPPAAPLEIEKLACKDEEIVAEEAVGGNMSTAEDLIEYKTDQIKLPAKSGENHSAEKEDAENNVKMLPSSVTTTTAKTRSRRNANKEEQPKKVIVENSVTETEPKSKMSARVRSQRAVSISDQTDIKTPLGKRGRGRLAREDTAPVDGDAEKIRTEDLKEQLVTDPVVTSTPDRKRGRKAVSEKDAPVPEEVSVLDSVHKSGQKRPAEEDPEIQTVDEDAENSLPALKRCRILNANTESKESEVSTPANAELPENDFNNPSKAEALGNKKRARVDTVKSSSESKTQSPLPKRGRRQETNSTKSKTTQEETNSELVVSDQDKKVGSDQIIPEKEEKTERGDGKQGRGRKMVSETVADNLKTDSEIVKAESEVYSEKRPARSRRAAVKEVSSSRAIEEVVDKLQSKEKSNEITVHVESQNTESEGTSENKPTRSRRAPVKDKESVKALSSQTAESNVKQETADAEALSIKSEEKISTRSRRAPPKSSANVSTSRVDEDISHKNPLEVVDAEDINEKTTTRTRKAAKNNTSIEVPSITEVDTVKVESEENLKKRPARSRRLPIKYNTSVEVSSSHTDDEHQNVKPSTGRQRKAASKSAPEDADANTSQHSTTAEYRGGIEDEQKEPEIVPKTTRGRKLAQIQDPKVDEKNTPTIRGRRQVAKVDTEDDAVEKQIQKPTRGKREVQVKTETSAANSSKVIVEEKESSAPPKRTTRARKAATQNEPSESEDEDHQKHSLKKATRSRKITEPALEDEAKESKRGNRHLQEVLPDDSSSTPKRTRRKLRT